MSCTEIKNISLEQKQNGLFKVRRLLGGGSVQNEEVAGNAFAATVTSSISRIFNPETTFDRELIVHEAYITSKRRERYIEPIDKVIRAAKTPSETDATKFEDTKTPNEIINKLKNAKTLENKILLLIGSVGSTTSTFNDTTAVRGVTYQYSVSAQDTNNAIIKLKPSTSKGTYLRGLSMASSMSPGIMVDTKSVLN